MSKFKSSITILLLLLFAGNLLACDMCGCFMGIVPYDHQSGISFMHRYRSFNGYAQPGQTHSFFPQNAYMTATPINSGLSHSANRMLHGDHLTTPATTSPVYANTDNEIYRTYELRAKLFIHKRIEINSIAAVNDNSSNESAIRSHVSGLSDITFYAGYHLLQRIDFVNLQQRLIVGGGLKLPVGNYYAQNEQGARYPLLLQPGTGSTDYFGYLTYVLGYKSWGLSLNTQYKWNGENYYQERIGNSTNNFFNLFYKIPVKQAVVIPSVQLYYEYTKGLYIDNALIPSSGMNVLMAGPGLDVHYKNFAFNTAFQFKVWEHTEAQNLSSAGKMIVGISYYFNQTNYLIKSKEKEIN